MEHASLRRHYPHRYQGCDLTASHAFLRARGPLAFEANVTPIAPRRQPRETRKTRSSEHRTFRDDARAVTIRAWKRAPRRGARGPAARFGKGITSLTTAKATAQIAAGPGPRASWWLVAAGLFVLALAVVLAFAVVRSGGGRLADAPAPNVADGAEVAAVQGTGRKDGQAFVLEAPGPEGIAVLTAKLAPFRAQDFSRVEWSIFSAQAPPELAVVWRTREHPKRNYTKRLRWLMSGAAPLELSAEDGWSGTITGVGLLVGPGLTMPLRVGTLRIASHSATVTAAEWLRQWTEPHPLRGYSVNFPFDAERAHDLPALTAVAGAEALAIGLYLLLARWRGWPRDRRVLWGVFVGGWLLLDLRWQANLWREARERGLRFAGKTTAEMHLAADDAALYQLIEKMKGALPATPSRVFLYCDNDNLCVRAAFMLYPQNVYRAFHWRRTLPAPEEMHAGDHVLLVYSRTLGYDPEHHAVVWSDGRTKPADEVLLEPGALLLRVR